MGWLSNDLLTKNLFPATCTDGDFTSSFTEMLPFPLIGASGAPEAVQTFIPEVCVNGVFGGICDRQFSNMSARVACNVLGSSSGVNITSKDYF